MQGKVVDAIRRAVERGDYDAILVYSTLFNTPEAQALLKEAIALFRQERREQMDGIKEWREEFNRCIERGAFDGG